MHNLFIHYELADVEENGDKVKRACQSLGNSTPLLSGCWYINSPYNADEAIKRIGGAFSSRDKLVIANTKTDSCCWLGIGDKEARRVRQNWKMMLRIDQPAGASQKTRADAV